MSGSTAGDVGGPDSYSLDCDTVNFRTQLRSIAKDMIARLEVGMGLPVADDDGTVVAVLPEDGSYVGSITYSKNVELIRCMAEGFEFVATIREIDDGLVTVQIAVA